MIFSPLTLPADKLPYVPRKLLYVHTQETRNTTWIIPHGFSRSLVLIIYDENEKIVPRSDYDVIYTEGTTTVQFQRATSGIAHILSRTGKGATHALPPDTRLAHQVSYNDVITFAIPKFITRMDSGAPNPTVTPPVTPIPLPPGRAIPFNICDADIRIEIEVTKPNAQSIMCTERIDTVLDRASPWQDWGQILVRNRKHYCPRTMSISKLNVLANTNGGPPVIPDGTTMKILRIDYGTGIFVNIPDRGLLVLMAESPFAKSDKIRDAIIDVGEMVNADISYFTFDKSELYADASVRETTYPEIQQYRF